jgi:hypothetical protein
MPYATGCRDCGGKLKRHDGTRCEPCRRDRAAAATRLREQRAAAGLCLHCGEPVVPKRLGNGPSRYCQRHLEMHAARQRQT